VLDECGGEGGQHDCTIRIVIVSLFAAGPALSQNLTADEARRLVIDKLIAFSCFDGSRGTGRIYDDGSIIGTIQFQGAGPVRSVWLPAGTLNAKGEAVCVSIKGRKARSTRSNSTTSCHTSRTIAMGR
jgi:hypothetical protein